MRLGIAATLTALTVSACTTFGGEAADAGAGVEASAGDAAVADGAVEVGVDGGGGADSCSVICDDFEGRTDPKGAWTDVVVGGPGAKIEIVKGSANRGEGGLRIGAAKDAATRQVFVQGEVGAGASVVTLRFAMRVDDAETQARIPNFAGGAGFDRQIGLQVDHGALNLVSQLGSTPRFLPAGTVGQGQWETYELEMDFDQLLATLTRQSGVKTILDMKTEWSGWTKTPLEIRFGAAFVPSNQTVAISLDDVVISRR